MYTSSCLYSSSYAVNHNALTYMWAQQRILPRYGKLMCVFVHRRCLGELLAANGKPEKALPIFQRSARIRQEIVGDRHCMVFADQVCFWTAAAYLP